MKTEKLYIFQQKPLALQGRIFIHWLRESNNRIENLFMMNGELYSKESKEHIKI